MLFIHHILVLEFSKINELISQSSCWGHVGFSENETLPGESNTQKKGYKGVFTLVIWVS